MADSLNPSILSALVEKLRTNESAVRVRISRIRRKYPGITLNAAAQILASKNKFSLMGRLDKEDRQSLSSISLVSYQDGGVAKRALRKQATPSPFKVFLRYQTSNPFQRRHVDEINVAYNAKCYTAVFILCRKVIENLIIDILVKRFPERRKNNVELYFDTSRKRFHDFSIILGNLHRSRSKFPPSVMKAIDRLVQKVRPFARDANDKTHSWFHLASKTELDGIGVREIIDLIIRVDSAIK